MKRACDFTDQTIGKLYVVRRATDKIGCYGQPVRQWECRCECGDIVLRMTNHLKRGNCSCKKCKAIEESKRWGYEEIRQHHWNTIERQAKKRDIEFKISIDYAWELYLNQNRKCSLSGLPITFSPSKKGHATGETTASLDRIDSDKGYIEGNVQWLHKWVNLMKSDFTQNEFLNYCRLIIEHNKEQ
jgi:hypothetical protein